MKRKISAAFAAVIAAGAITGCVPRIAREAVNAVSDQVSQKVSDKVPDKLENLIAGLKKDEEETEEHAEPGEVAEGGEASSGKEDTAEEDTREGNTAEEEPEREDPYEAYVRDILEGQLGSMRDLSFTYGFVRRNTDTAYWYAEAETAPLDDSLISASKQDLDKDGQEELLVTYLEGSRGTGSGHNCLRMDVYGIAEGQVRKIGGISFPNCFETYNSETYMAGTKDMGDYQLLYVYDDRGIWTWADGVNPQIRLYRYNGRRMDEIYSVSCSGSDGSWWEEWERDLRTLGFEIPGGLWNNECLEGESGFQVLMYGEGTTIADTKVMYNYGSGVGSEQQYMLDKGVVEAGIYGETGSVVERMNRSMKPYSENTADYIIPDSSIRYLTRTELLGLSAEQLRLARNEIYARHGRKFQTQDLQDYFNSKSWYMGTIEPDRFSDDNLNVYEKENLKLIKSLEQ